MPSWSKYFRFQFHTCWYCLESKELHKTWETGKRPFTRESGSRTVHSNNRRRCTNTSKLCSRLGRHNPTISTTTGHPRPRQTTCRIQRCCCSNSRRRARSKRKTSEIPRFRTIQTSRQNGRVRFNSWIILTKVVHFQPFTKPKIERLANSLPLKLSANTNLTPRRYIPTLLFLFLVMRFSNGCEPCSPRENRLP